MANGPFIWLNKAKKKINSVIDFNAGSFALVLCTSSQTLGPTFLGTSADCRYADLTAELPTANGYTAGGAALTGVSFTEDLTAGTVTFTANPLTWTLSSSITYKYAVLRKVGGNNDLIAVMDANTSGGSSTPDPGTLTITPNVSGIVGWS
jgi:hypothetical protein